MTDRTSMTGLFDVRAPLRPRASAAEPILDTSTKFSPSETQTALPVAGTQFGLDGHEYLPAPPAASGANTLPELTCEQRRQLAFEFEGYEQMTMRPWQQSLGDLIDWFRGEESKRGKRARECGTIWAVPYCRDCQSIDVKRRIRSGNCELRVCPRCARGRGQERRADIVAMLNHTPIQKRGSTWWMHTLTLKRPKWTNVERLENDLDLAWRAWAECWKFLHEFGGAHGAYCKIEVTGGGMVHIHAIVYHVRLKRHVLDGLRKRYRDVTGSNWYKVTQCYKRDGAARELSKYMVKGVAMDKRPGSQTHPLLAAMVDTAFAHRKEYRSYGIVRQILGADPEAPKAHKCACCGGLPHLHWGRMYVPEDMIEKLLAWASTQRGPP